MTNGKTRYFLDLLIELGRVAYECKVEFGHLPKIFKSEGRIIDVADNQPELIERYESSVMRLKPLFEHTMGLAAELLRESNSLDAENLGYFIAGMKVGAANQVFISGSVNIHERFILSLLEKDDQRIWEARDIPNFVEPNEWAYYYPDLQVIPDKSGFEAYQRGKEKEARLKVERAAKICELDRIMNAQDKVASAMKDSPSYADLLRVILNKTPIEQLLYIAENERYPITAYPPEIAKGISKEVIQQLDAELLKRLVWLLTYRKIDNPKWGRFKHRLLSVAQKKGI